LIKKSVKYTKGTKVKVKVPWCL